MDRSSSLPSLTAVNSNSPSRHPAGALSPGLATKLILSRTRKTQIPFMLSRANLLSPSPPRHLLRRVPRPRIAKPPCEYRVDVDFFSHMPWRLSFHSTTFAYAFCTAQYQILAYRPRTAPISTRPHHLKAPRLLAQIVLPPQVVPASYSLRSPPLSFKRLFLSSNSFVVFDNWFFSLFLPVPIVQSGLFGFVLNDHAFLIADFER